MSSAERPGAVLDRVCDELRAMWTSPGPGEIPRARACTMNLVVVAGSTGDVEEWLPVVDEVLLGTPARAIVVGLDADGGDGLDASTSAVCAPRPGGGALVCSERVTLVARGAVRAHVASCIAALCVNDVPTTLVWPGRVSLDDASFEPLARDASRIVLDATEGAALSGLARVVSWACARAPGDRPGVADLAWTRLAPWQEMCARMFDEPRLRSLASRVTRVSLVQASPTGGPIGPDALLLLGWLASRLGWQADTPGSAPKARSLRRSDGGRVEVRLSAEGAAGAPSGALVAVRLDAEADGWTFRGEIARETGDAESATWRLHVAAPGMDPQRLEQHVRLLAPKKARLLERTLHRPTHDAALADAAAWADGLGEEELATGGEGDRVFERKA